MIYIIIFMVVFLGAILDLVETPISLRWITAVFIFFMLILVAGMRWQIGPDWDSYHSFFIDYELYRDGFYINMLEPGYTLLNGFIKTFSDNYTVFLFFIAILTIGIKFSIFLKHKEIFFLLLFLYYCYYLADIASVRQFTSLAVTLLSGYFIIKKKPFHFGICLFVAITIHVSSVAFLGAYWLYHKKFSVKILYLFLILSFIAGFLNLSGLILGKAIGFLGSSSIYAEKLLNYSDSGIESSTGNPYMNFILGAVKRAVIIPILFYYKDKVMPKYADIYRGYLNLLVIGNVIYFLFILSFPEITRLSVSYLYYEIFLLSFVVISITDKKLKFAVFAMLVFFGAFRLYSFMAPFMDLYLPYKTFLSY